MHYYTFFRLRIVILLGFLLSCFAVEAQNPVPFTARKNLNVRGDVTMIILLTENLMPIIPG